MTRTKAEDEAYAQGRIAGLREAAAIVAVAHVSKPNIFSDLIRAAADEVEKGEA